MELDLRVTQIMEDIEHYDIPVYNFPYDVEEDDEETIEENSELRVIFEFPSENFHIELFLGSHAFRYYWFRRRD